MFENIGLFLRSDTLRVEVDEHIGIANVFDIIEQHQNEETRNVTIRYRKKDSKIKYSNAIFRAICKKYTKLNNLRSYVNPQTVEFVPDHYTRENDTSIQHIIGFMHFLDSYLNHNIQMYYTPTCYERLNSVYNLDLFNIALMLGPNTYRFFEKPIMNTITKSHFIEYGITFPEDCLNPNGIALNLEQFQNRPIDNELVNELKEYVIKTIKYNRKHEVK